MNYGLALSLKVEKFLLQLLEEREREKEQRRQLQQQQQQQRAGGTGGSGVGASSTSARSGATGVTTATSATGSTGTMMELDIEERALQLALEETYEESGRRWMPWAANSSAIRVGDVILIVDSDTVVPEDCLRDAARELAASPEVAIIQHESGECCVCGGFAGIGWLIVFIVDVMQVAHHWFENGIAHFTKRINKCISMGALPFRCAFVPPVDDCSLLACANGEVAPFVGHNAYVYLFPSSNT